MGRRHRAAHVLGTGRGHAAERLAVRRILGLEPLAVRGRDHLAVDQHPSFESAAHVPPSVPDAVMAGV